MNDYFRWNFEIHDNNVWYCDGEHEKSCGCQYEPMPAEMIVEAINSLGTENVRLRAALAEARRLLEQAKPYVAMARNVAEARHDDPDGGYYMDSVQYEVMNNAEAVIGAIDAALEEKCSGRH